MSALPLTPNSGRYRDTGWSTRIRPRSTCCITTIEVNSLEIDARSKIVLSAIGTRCSTGSSVPLASE